MKTLMKTVCAVRRPGEFSALANDGKPQVFSGYAVKQVLASVMAIVFRPGAYRARRQSY
jgi:S-adenosylmethionine synthetase